MLSIFDDALIRLVEMLKWRGKSIPVVQAGADRAHAALEEWLERNRGIKSSQLGGEKTFPYPFAAIKRDLLREELAKSNPGVMRNIFKDKDRGVGFAMRSPQQSTCDFDVNFYFDDDDQLKNFELQVNTLFPMGTAWITVDFGDTKWYHNENAVFSYAKVLKFQTLQVDLSEFVENSSIEQPGLDQREIRATMGGVLHAVIPFQPYAVPLAVDTEIKIISAADEVTEIDSILVEGEQ